MKMLLLIMVSAACFAQTAKVIPLSDADAKRAQAAYDALQAAQKAWDAVQLDIEHKYISEPREVTDYALASDGTASGCLVVSGGAGGIAPDCPETASKPRKEPPKKTVYERKVGWYNGFDFSEGFRFIVPKPVVPNTSPSDYLRFIPANANTFTAPVANTQ